MPNTTEFYPVTLRLDTGELADTLSNGQVQSGAPKTKIVVTREYVYAFSTESADHALLLACEARMFALRSRP